MQRHAAIGDGKVKTGDGRWKAIRGISEGKKIYVKANNGYTAEQIAKHEYFHQAADERVVKGIWEEVKRRYEPEVVEELKRKYEEGYEGCYEGGRKIEEEIAADVYSGMNVFEEVGEEIRRYAEDLLEGKGARQENIDRGGEGSYDGKRDKSDEITQNSITIDPKDIRYSQTSVNNSSELIKSMKTYGWKGAPIYIVKMPDGKYTTLDNTRVVAANATGTQVQAKVHEYGDLLSKSEVFRFTTKKGIPKTWGEAVELRINKQRASFRNENPYGKFEMETIK